MHLILASSSADRKRLLKQVGIKFDVIVSNAEEISDSKNPGKYVEEISSLKALATSKEVEEGVIIAADTVTVTNGNIFGKPKTREEAINMILLSSEKTSEVYTGVTIIDKYQSKTIVFHSMSKIYMNKITREEAETYIDKDKMSMFRSGAYAIDGMSSIFTSKIEGDYSNIVGLPIAEIFIKLKELGYSMKDITI